MSENEFEYSQDRADVAQGAIGELHASTANLERSAVRRLHAETVNASRSAIGVAHTTTLESREGSIGFATGDYVRVENGTVFALLAPRVSGNVRAVFTVQAAFALGLGIVLGRAIMRIATHRKNDEN